MSCGVGRRRGSDPMLLWLWCRPAAVVAIQALAWEPPCAGGVALKCKAKQNKQAKSPSNHPYVTSRECSRRGWSHGPETSRPVFLSPGGSQTSPVLALPHHRCSAHPAGATPAACPLQEGGTAPVPCGLEWGLPCSLTGVAEEDGRSHVKAGRWFSGWSEVPASCGCWEMG